MAQLEVRAEKYKPQKDIKISWDTFRGGLNLLLQDTEIEPNELAQADNVVLVGKGVPKKRWGSLVYYTAGNATGSVRGLVGYYPSGASGTIELLAITDDGYLTKKNGSTFDRINGASWASGFNAQMAQLDNKVYITNGQRELVRYSSPTLVGFPTIAAPTISSATNLSGATGTTVKSYRISAVSNVGETLASGAFQLAAQPLNLGGAAGGVIRLAWSTVSTASGILQGYNLYGRNGGFERFLAFVPGTTTTFDDDGSSPPKEFTFPPTADSTGGPKASYIERYQDRLIFAGFPNEPEKVLVSGRVPNQEKYDLANGGGFVFIEPDAGDHIRQIVGFRDRIIVLKEKSLWQVYLKTEQVAAFFVTEPTAQLITAAQGCVASGSVVAVDNDIFYLSRRGVHTLGYETGFNFDVLRTNEISVKMRPYFENLTELQMKSAVAVYFRGKYFIAFPERDEMLVFDKERLAWTGPWTIDATVFEVYYDRVNKERLLLAQEGSTQVDELSESFTDDNGDTIKTVVRTRSEDFGDWSLFKNIKNIFAQFRSVSGSVLVDIRLETRKGRTITSKSSTISTTQGNSGWGADLWADTLWGDSEQVSGGGDANFLMRWFNLNKIGRTMQLTITTTGKNSNYELVGIRAEAKPLGRGFTPSSWSTG